MALFRGINVVSLSVPDLDAARVFYRDVLGLGEPLFDLPEIGWVEFSTGAAHGNVAVTLAAPGWQPSHTTTLVLNTADCHATRADLFARGAAATSRNWCRVTWSIAASMIPSATASKWLAPPPRNPLPNLHASLLPHPHTCIDSPPP